jgi:chemotaxis methyl-accepting protein methylase
VGELERLGRVHIVGTDIDRGSLESARRAEFPEAAFADTPPDIRRAYFTSTPPFALRREVRELVRFEQRDLLRQPAPGAAQHLVVCRNVVIYFDRVTQEELFARFHEALAPGGYLMLGKVETLLGPARSRFAPVEPRERIFRRP